MALALLIGSSARSNGQATGQPAGRSGVPISFDISARPLVQALDAYSAATGLMVLYDSDLVQGRRSTAVSGVLMPDVAIRVLLEGTGLVVFNAGKAFAVEAERSDEQGGADPFRAAELTYLAVVQRTVERVFCQTAETRPGEYRAALQFRIDASGDIRAAELLSSTGDPRRDRMIVELLGGLRIRRAPPPRMAQPVSMIIAPRPPARSGDCRVSDDAAAPPDQP